MSVTHEQFAQGLSYDAFKAQMTRNRERLEANEQTIELSGDDVAFFTDLPQPLHVVAIGEDWCGDVIANFPVLARLAELTGKLDVRYFPRDQHLDLMDQYLKEGQFRSIPVFAFFDQQFNPIGHWIERPASVTQRMQDMRSALFANEPELAGIAPDMPVAQMPEPARLRLMEGLSTFREEQRVFSDNEVVRDLRRTVEQGLKPGQPAADAPSAEVATPAVALAAQATTALPFKRADRARAKNPVKVRITYCAECGYEPQTLELTSALMHEFVYDLAAIELIPWHDGSFEVAVNDDLIHSMYRDGGFPESAAIISAVRERLAS